MYFEEGINKNVALRFKSKCSKLLIVADIGWFCTHYEFGCFGASMGMPWWKILIMPGVIKVVYISNVASCLILLLNIFITVLVTRNVSVFYWLPYINFVCFFAERFKFLNPNVWENRTFVHYIKANETSTISCQAEGPGDVAPKISWSYLASNNKTFPREVFISPNLTTTTDLVFKQASTAQNGMYQCLARLENPGTAPEELTLKFDVKVLDDS